MFARATTSVTILGGSSTDDLGDTRDGITPSATGVPASIIERNTRVTLPVDMRVQTVYFYTGRLPAGTVVSKNNRLLDERTGATYVVDNVAQPGSPVHTNDLRLELRRVSA